MRLLRHIALATVAVAATIYLVRAFDARRMPDLQPWHTVSLEREYRVERDGEDLSFAAWLELEDALFRELESEICSRVDCSEATRTAERWRSSTRSNRSGTTAFQGPNTSI